MQTVNGLLLVNLGSPEAPTPGAVRTYLRQFLSDPRVLDINPIGRKLLLEGLILPTRPAKSAAAYQVIWGERGSPLVAYGRDLTAAVAETLGEGWKVELAMRYGEPSIPRGLDALRGVDRLVVFPLYPQYASASTGSTLEEVFRHLAEKWVVPAISVVPAFYEDPAFLDAFAVVGREVLGAGRFDHVLFSYHGLPERHMHKSDPTGSHCLKSDGCCDRIVDANHDCYRAQCYATTRGLVSRLGLTADGHSVSFQSRLGRTPWIKPYTDLVLPELAQKGKRRLAVFSPAFVADCLETLEEIGVRAVEQWKALGGEELVLVPSLNATPAWVAAVCALARRT
jgi:ferrochelatase